MCGRFFLIGDVKSLMDFFETEIDLDIAPNYNACPSQMMPVMMNSGSVELARFGLIPHWAKDAKMGFKMINARAETIHEKPAYRAPFSRQRCLIPASGFFEWKKVGTTKIPFKITCSRDLFAFAGIWDCWEHDGTVVHSFSIVTTEADAQMKPYHTRMPVIVSREDHEKWLHLDTEAAKEFLASYTCEPLTFQKISTAVNAPSNNSPAVLQPVTDLSSFQ